MKDNCPLCGKTFSAHTRTMTIKCVEELLHLKTQLIREIDYHDEQPDFER